MVISSRSSARRRSDSIDSRSALARAHGGLEHLDAIAAAAFGVIHREFGVLEHFLAALRLAVAERQSDRRGEENFAVAEGDRRAQRLANGFGEPGDARRVALRQQDQAELIARQARQRVLRLDQPPDPPRQREQDRVADRHADGVVDLLEAVEIDHHDSRPQRGVRSWRGRARHRAGQGTVRGWAGRSDYRARRRAGAAPRQS